MQYSLFKVFFQYIFCIDNKIAKFYGAGKDLIKVIHFTFRLNTKNITCAVQISPSILGSSNLTWSDLAHQLPPKFAVFTQASTEGRREGGRKARKVPIWRQRFSQAMLCHNLWFSRPLGLVMPVLL